MVDMGKNHWKTIVANGWHVKNHRQQWFTSKQNHWKIIDHNGFFNKKHCHFIVLKNLPLSCFTSGGVNALHTHCIVWGKEAYQWFARQPATITPHLFAMRARSNAIVHWHATGYVIAIWRLWVVIWCIWIAAGTLSPGVIDSKRRVLSLSHFLFRPQL